MKCPNCGQNTRVGSSCGCSWDEMIAASRKIERERRDSGEKKVVVDLLPRNDSRTLPRENP